jgi:TonB family protein
MRYPRNALNDWSEGWVLLEFAVSAQGVPANMTVVDAIGPKDFVKVAVEGVSRWRYKPATRNGAPVEQSLTNVEVQFLFYDSGKGADHGEFVAKYNRARNYARDNRPDEAIAELELAFRSRLNLYEAAMGSFILAVAYAHKEDWERALYHARHANISQGKYLEKAWSRTPTPWRSNSTHAQAISAKPSAASRGCGRWTQAWRRRIRNSAK